MWEGYISELGLSATQNEPVTIFTPSTSINDETNKEPSFYIHHAHIDDDVKREFRGLCLKSRFSKTNKSNTSQTYLKPFDVEMLGMGSSRSGIDVDVSSQVPTFFVTDRKNNRNIVATTLNLSDDEGEWPEALAQARDQFLPPRCFMDALGNQSAGNGNRPPILRASALLRSIDESRRGNDDQDGQAGQYCYIPHQRRAAKR